MDLLTLCVRLHSGSCLCRSQPDKDVKSPNMSLRGRGERMRIHSNTDSHRKSPNFISVKLVHTYIQFERIVIIIK